MTWFGVEGIFTITGRGPVITRCRPCAKAAASRGDSFTPGQKIHCGWMEATIKGVERGLTTDPTQQGLLLDIPLDWIKLGQVWVSVD